LEGKRSRVSKVANLPYFIDDKRRAGIDAGRVKSYLLLLENKAKNRDSAPTIGP